MLHLRVVAHPEQSNKVRALLGATPSVRNFVVLLGVDERPDGDVILCDVATADASMMIADLHDLHVPARGSIAVQFVDMEVSRASAAEVNAARGLVKMPWERVETRASESTQASADFLAFMILAMLITASGIFLATPFSSSLIIGSMIVGADFGPLAGVCVATVERRAGPAIRSLLALLAGFGAACCVTAAVSLVFKQLGITGPLVESASHLTPGVAEVVGGPGFFSFFVAFCAGVAGVLSLSGPKSGALIGVLVSVTTIPAAANAAVTTAYGQWSHAWASAAQLGANVGTVLVAGTVTLTVQRLSFARRRARREFHLPTSGYGQRP